MGAETVIVTTPGEVTEKGSEEVIAETAATALDAAIEIVEVATVIADKIETAREEEEGEVFEVITRLDACLSGLSDLSIRMDLLFDKIAELKAVEVAEIVVENTPKEVEEIAAVVELVEEETNTPPVVETVEVATTPQIKKKNPRKWL